MRFLSFFLPAIIAIFFGLIPSRNFRHKADAVQIRRFCAWADVGVRVK